MKKRNVMSAALCTASALALSLGLAACGDESLPADEWTAAIGSAAEATSYTVNTKSWSGSATEPILSVNKVENGNYSVLIGAGTAYEEETYYAKDGDKYFVYSKNADVWGREEITQTQYDTVTGASSDEGLIFIAAVKDKFASFTYNETEKTYVAQNIVYTAGTASKVIAEIADGKLVSFSVEGFAGQNVTQDFTYSAFGATTVTLPVIDGVDQGGTQGGVTPTPSGTVSAEQWTHILESASNFTINASGTTIKINGDVRSYESSQGSQIFVKNGTNYYQYSLNGSTWTKGDLKAENYEQFTGIYAKFLSFFKNDYESFTYADGVYSAASLDKTSEMNATVSNVKITFSEGALVGMELTIGEDSAFMKYTVTNVGATQIPIPQI